MKKTLMLFAVLVVIFSCAEKKNNGTASNGKKIFKQNCVICHGLDGKLGLNNSKDLTKSALTMDERVSIIKNGKGAMTAFGAILDAKDIQAVTEYTFSLK